FPIKPTGPKLYRSLRECRENISCCTASFVSVLTVITERCGALKGGRYRFDSYALMFHGTQPQVSCFTAVGPLHSKSWKIWSVIATVFFNRATRSSGSSEHCR